MERNIYIYCLYFYIFILFYFIKAFSVFNIQKLMRVDSILNILNVFWKGIKIKETIKENSQCFNVCIVKCKLYISHLCIAPEIAPVFASETVITKSINNIDTVEEWLHMDKRWWMCVRHRINVERRKQLWRLWFYSQLCSVECSV